MIRPAALRDLKSSGGALIGALLLLSACGSPDGTVTLAVCPSSTPIHAIQGREFDSGMLGETVSTTGVITLRTDSGLYIESLDPDRDPKTSEGLFLATASPDPSLQPGMVVTASGTVDELGERRDTQTALVNLTGLNPCGEPRARPMSTATLPMGGRDREALENMRVSFESASIITDVYRLSDGEFQIARDFYLPAPTEVARPGDEAQQQQSRNWAYSLYAELPPGESGTFRVGDELLSDAGVLGHDGIGPRLYLEESPRLIQQAIPEISRPLKGAVRVVSLNLQNYFNGDGAGAGFPTPRGAETRAEFDAQRERFRAVLAQLQPDVVAVQELENDGFSAGSAAQDFIEDLRQASGASWAVAQPEASAIGTDEITVGLFYRTDLFTPVGPARLLDAAPFDLLNRVPVAQVLEHSSSGERVAVSVNHFKSKGSCPDQGRDEDQRDGQGCWNAARLAAAQALGPWLMTLADNQAQGKALLLGDLNAYRMENPIQYLIAEGYRDLTASIGERHQYSYVFRGQSGTLDHALATPALADDVESARIQNINAGFPPRMDLSPDWVRSSDHDPVIVDIRLGRGSD